MTSDPHTPIEGSDSPAVITFPPVIFAVFFIIGYVTDRALPVALGAPTLRLYAGAALVALSVGLVGWAGLRFLHARTHIDVRKPALNLVTGGPYRLSRNPMYLAATMLYAGIALVLSLGWTLATLIPCLVVLHYGVIRREERYLEGRFGAAYLEYRSRVRRWL